GPEREPLFVTRGNGAASAPIWILDPKKEWGVIDGPTCHPSVTMRRDAYERAGGYRAAFAVGQDWDLWYRLAEQGEFQIAQAILYTAAITPDGISAAARNAQQELADLSRSAMLARSRGESDEDIVRRAAAVNVVRTKTARSRARGLYAIGEALRRNGDPRARRYFRRAIALFPFFVRAWIRYAQTFVKG
ncbi:MAG: tetratricopeptide repeat protein, partial [Thermoanaerobaculia bacterium]